MPDKIISFDEAKSPHDLRRKEKKLDDMKARFAAHSGLEKPTRPKKKKRSKKPRKRK